MRLVSVFKSAAERYGTERRVILLHGPVGSSKSTIARLLKRGMEEYSRTPEGALYPFEWALPPGLESVAGGSSSFKCPMHEEPLRVIPPEWRKKALVELGLNTPEHEKVHIEGDLDPACRLIFRELMAAHKGDWAKVTQCVKVRRLILSEQDRVGIGTFQPKDEKNQDSTELTGDINYRKIAEFGSDSDPRAFNFDGEFNIANRGVIEFIEVLKLDVAFLYDLLGASQEQKMKLYDGKTLPGFTQDNIKELRKEANREGMDGISPRYIQDKISNALVSDRGEGCVNPFMVMNELESGLRHHSLITNEEQRKNYGMLLGLVKQEYEDVVKNEVQRAISADEEAIAKLCANYIDNIKAYTQREKVKNKYTGQDEEPDERMMRSIEEKIDIPESRKDEFRREIMNYIGALAVER